jgi:two-component system chemotaxis response regulator CheY
MRVDTSKVKVAVIAEKFMRDELRGNLAGTKYVIAGEADFGDEALEKLDEWRPQLIALFVNAPGHRDRPGEGGIGIIKRVLEQDAKARVLAIYDVDTKMLKVAAIKAGAAGAIGYPFRRDDVIKALATAESAPSGEVALQRSDVRLKKPLAVKYKKTTDGFFTGMRNGVTQDVSPSGICMSTPEALPERLILKLEVELPGQAKIYARGKVVRCKPIVGLGMNEVGVSFTEIKEEDVERLRSFIITHVAKGGKAY